MKLSNWIDGTKLTSPLDHKAWLVVAAAANGCIDKKISLQPVVLHTTQLLGLQAWSCTPPNSQIILNLPLPAGPGPTNYEL